MHIIASTSILSWLVVILLMYSEFCSPSEVSPFDHFMLSHVYFDYCFSLSYQTFSLYCFGLRHLLISSIIIVYIMTGTELEDKHIDFKLGSGVFKTVRSRD